MSFSLFDATVPSYLQILGSVSRLLDKAESWCHDNNHTPDTLIQARLASDMLPFAYQVSSTSWHSMGAIVGVRNGVFHPDKESPPEDFPGLKEKIATTITDLRKIEKAEVDDFLGKGVHFQMGQYQLDFTAEDFLLSFSQPNFYFHAATAYDILRWKGLPVGKGDFMGQIRVADRSRDRSDKT